MGVVSKVSILILLGLGFISSSFAQSSDSPYSDVTNLGDGTILVDRKFYTASGIDGLLFSSAVLTRPGVDDRLTPMRFSLLGFGITLHYDFSRSFGAYTGVSIKNIGFIEKFSGPDSTVKRRVYALGVPLAIKLGNLKARKFVFAGGGADLALNYKEKGFVKRGDKTKFHEWFSDRTPALMPYLFVGASVDPGITFKLQYYPGNFLNPEFTPRSGIQPYAGYHVHLFFVSLGIDLHYDTLPLKVKVN